ncbi:MAG: 50S ribosomal protein L5 [Thermoplasmatota archaeon]
MADMQAPRIAKVTVNMGVGEGGDRLAKAEATMEKLTGQKPMRTFGKMNNRDLGVRPGMPIGCKVTLRGEGAESFVQRALYTRHNKIFNWSFDNQGNLQFGVTDHTTFEGERYDPEIGVFGMDVAITLEKPGHRIKHRRLLSRKVPARHRVTREEALAFLTEKFTMEVV